MINDTYSTIAASAKVPIYAWKWYESKSWLEHLVPDMKKKGVTLVLLGLGSFYAECA
jgi:hypothetical protein